MQSDEDELEIGDDDDDEQAFIPPPSLPQQYASANLGFPNDSNEKFGVHQHPMEMRGDGLGGYSSGEDSRALLSLEQNIANLERSIRRSGGGSTSKLTSVGNERNVQVRFAGRRRVGRENNNTDNEGGHLIRSTSLNIATETEGSEPKKTRKSSYFASNVKKRLVLYFERYNCCPIIKTIYKRKNIEMCINHSKHTLSIGPQIFQTYQH